MDMAPPDTGLPIPYVRRLDAIAEQTFYVARPGIRAIPSGAGTVTVFVGLQAFTLIGFLWAIWWPQPSSTSDYIFAISATSVLAALVLLIIGVLMRRYPGFVLAVLRSPFICLKVTNRRLLWTLPWMKEPLIEIGRDRILGGLLGNLDHRGNGPAAVVLVPGDPYAEIDGNIHFDRLPDAAAFVAALERW
ncbi:MAG: hypothetical protein JF628_07660 [Sphingomonas sp.]|nr:hypothetical protein [Sphingomonas sp.]